MPTKKSHKGLKTGLELVGLAAAAAAGAYYFFGSPKAKTHRKQVKAWSLKAKAEVMEKLEDLKEVSKPTYDKAVKEVTAKYKKIKKIAPKEIAALERELKSYWKHIEKEVKKAKAKHKKK